jgi:prepilin-type N-terminal cleavage/methylation domain-containing protein
MSFRSRAGFTLIEMSIVLAIMAIASGLVVPALVDLGRTPQRRTADQLLSLLNATRRVAIDHNVTVTLVLDPKSGNYRVDSTGLFGSGPVIQSQIDLLGMESMVTDLPRLNFSFRPTGAAMGDTVRVRGADSSVVVSVDPWSGVAYAGQ